MKKLVSTGSVQKKRAGGRTRPFDAAVCPGATLADLSEKKMREFLLYARAERKYSLSSRTPVAAQKPS